MIRAMRVSGYCLSICLLVGCSAHSSGIDPQTQGMPNQSLDAVIKNIQEQPRGEDRMGASSKPIKVYMAALPDENNTLNDEGLITLKGD